MRCTIDSVPGQCQCVTCRDFDFSRWCWKYVPVRYEERRSDLRKLLEELQP